MIKLKAKWIWHNQKDLTPYNQSVIATKSFTLPNIKKAKIAITADCWYRLNINGHWINDGPCRSWPEHHQYDMLDVAWALKPGHNEITVTARHWHVGGFLQCPVQAGLLVQLDITLANGRKRTIASDKTWSVAKADQWIENTPKDSIQMGPAELCDARLGKSPKFAPARVICNADKGPWKDLRPAEIVPKTLDPVSLQKFMKASIVRSDGTDFCFPRVGLVFPKLVEANTTVMATFAIATSIKLPKDSTVRICAGGPRNANPRVLVDGKFHKDQKHRLKAGTHLVLIFSDYTICHDKDFNVRFICPQRISFKNPLEARHENPWAMVDLSRFAYINDDMRWVCFSEEDKEFVKARKKYIEFVSSVEKKITDKKSFIKVIGSQCKLLSSKMMLLRDSYPEFTWRKVIADASENVKDPAALMHQNSNSTVVTPSIKGDIELLYDLGRQDCGYFEIDLLSDAGVIIDIHAVENIEGNRIQHTHYNRNTMRYITKQGANRYISLKRRAGRFLFVTIRNAKSPLTIRNIGLISSTYPVEKVGSFSCSDSRLTDIWKACAHTLQLCMEDTFTDCPLYEQVFWVGDSQGEALFAYPIFGATDIARRGLELAAQSLDRLPMVGCQVPSSWDCIIPIWSFLWCISAWDYYWYSGDKKFLAKIWPAVVKNLKQAEKLVDSKGLFTAPFWNMFDWAKIDDEQECVLHNSIFMVGAIDAARKCAGVLNKKNHDLWLLSLRKRLCKAINSCWDDKRKAILTVFTKTVKSAPRSVSTPVF
jgi:alpha-L-rhamnosidase